MTRNARKLLYPVINRWFSTVNHENLTVFGFVWMFFKNLEKIDEKFRKNRWKNRQIPGFFSKNRSLQLTCWLSMSSIKVINYRQSHKRSKQNVELHFHWEILSNWLLNSSKFKYRMTELLIDKWNSRFLTVSFPNWWSHLSSTLFKSLLDSIRLLRNKIKV